MRYVISILLLVLMGTLASGYLQAMHAREHDREDEAAEAVGAAAAEAQGAGEHRPAHPGHAHSDGDCPICAQFHAPLLAMAPITWLADTGCFVTNISMLMAGQGKQAFAGRISCRGPPGAL